jgi:hypothetical protein
MGYSLTFEEMIWVLRLEGRTARLKAFLSKEDALRHVEELSAQSNSDLLLTVSSVRGNEVLSFTGRKKIEPAPSIFKLGRRRKRDKP